MTHLRVGRAPIRRVPLLSTPTPTPPSLTFLMDSLQEYIGLAEELRTQFASGEDAALVTAAVAAGAELAAAAAAREGRATTEIERELV